MKPINDDLRKKAFSRAGFFTLIPMLLVGVLVWSGMRNGVVNDEIDSEKFTKMERELTSANEVIDSIITLQNTMDNMFESRNTLEKDYIKVFDKDSSSISEERDLLQAQEKKIKDFLNTKQENSESLLRPIIVQYDKRLKLSQKIWKGYTGGSNDKAEVERLNKKIDGLNEENSKLKEKCNSSVPEIINLQNQIVQLNRDKEGLNSNLSALKGFIGTHINQMNGLRIDLGPKIDDIPEIVNKGNDKKISDEERRKVDNLIREIQSTISDMKNKLDLLDSNKSRY